MVLGNIHSIESMGLVDGPGIRTVVFLQGCHLRCRYCHNPDTWATKDSKNLVITPKELVSKLLRFQPYYGTSGGVTFSGGEPLLQSEFLLETLKLCKQANIHTCIDTAGVGNGNYEQLLEYTDLVLYDVKHYTESGYQNITGCSIKQTTAFLDCVQKMHKPLWIRHVVVPTLTDSEKHLEGLETFLKSLQGIKRIELLPYHTLGVPKYHTLNIPYSLEGIAPMKEEGLKKWNERLNQNCCQK